MTSPASAAIRKAALEAEAREYKRLERRYREKARTTRDEIRRFCEANGIPITRIPAEPTEAEHHE